MFLAFASRGVLMKHPISLRAIIPCNHSPQTPLNCDPSFEIVNLAAKRIYCHFKQIKGNILIICIFSNVWHHVARGKCNAWLRCLDQVGPGFWFMVAVAVRVAHSVVTVLVEVPKDCIVVIKLNPLRTFFLDQTETWCSSRGQSSWKRGCTWCSARRPPQRHSSTCRGYTPRPPAIVRVKVKNWKKNKKQDQLD